MLDQLCLINMNARMYDPGLGQFLQADTIVPNPYSFSGYLRYSYVGNNPLNATDPSGHHYDGSYHCFTGTHICPPSYSPSGQPIFSPYDASGAAFLSGGGTWGFADLTGFQRGVGTPVGSLNPNAGCFCNVSSWDEGVVNGFEQVVVQAAWVTLSNLNFDSYGSGANYGVSKATLSNRALSMGFMVGGSIVNPFTSGQGVVWGRNYQYVPGFDQEIYRYNGTGTGFDMGLSAQSVWAFGSGPWTGEFDSLNFSASIFSGSVFWSPDSSWVGFSFGFSLGLPGLAYESTYYQPDL